MKTLQERIHEVQAAHDLDAKQTKQLNDPGSMSGMWTASCTCGTYTCRPQATSEDARALVYTHIRKIFRRLEKDGFFAEQAAGGEA